MKRVLHCLKRFADAAVELRARSVCDHYLLQKATLRWRLGLVMSKTMQQRCRNGERWHLQRKQAVILHRLWQSHQRCCRSKASQVKAKLHQTARGQQQFQASIQPSTIKSEEIGRASCRERGCKNG